MPRPEQKGLPRASEWQDWPKETREPYIKLFSLQERLRARLKLAQELAVHNLVVKYPGSNPRQTNPIPIAGKQPEDHLGKYKAEQLPYIRDYLSRMQGEIEKIKRAFTSGRRPNWYKQTLSVEELAVKIWKKMDHIEVHLILTFKGDNQALKKSNEVIIEATKFAIETAEDIKKELLFIRPARTTIGPDKFGIYDTIIDLAPHTSGELSTNEQDKQPEPESKEQHIMDLTTTALWQSQNQHKKRRG